MCIVFWAVPRRDNQQACFALYVDVFSLSRLFEDALSPEFRLSIIASNRDEFLDRPAQALHRWESGRVVQGNDYTVNDATRPFPPWTVVAGRDLQGLGTWLGVAGRQTASDLRATATTTATTRIAVLTNIREVPAAAVGATAVRPSRGTLPVDFLLHDMASTHAFIAQKRRTMHEYDGFNLLMFEQTVQVDIGDEQASATEAHYLSNRHPDEHVEFHSDVTTHAISGDVYTCHGLSNGVLGTEGRWPKVRDGRHDFHAVLHENLAGTTGHEDDATDEDRLVERIFTILRNETLHVDEPFPPTGMPDHIERDLSSICVRVPARRYGSRTSTVILVRNNGSFNNGAAPAQPRLRIVERNYEMSADVDGMFHLVDERDEIM